jgi:hypothetical protein
VNWLRSFVSDRETFQSISTPLTPNARIGPTVSLRSHSKTTESEPLNPKPTSRTRTRRIPSRGNWTADFRDAGFTATWNAKRTSACHGKDLHSTSSSRLCVQLVSRKLARTLFAAKPMMHPGHVPEGIHLPPAPDAGASTLPARPPAQRSGSRNQELQNSHLTLTDNPLPYGCG